MIAAAWQRAGRAGLRPDARPEPLLHDVETADPLLDAARPVLERAATILTGTDTALLLVDSQCRMVSRVTAGTTLEGRLEQAGVIRGAAFDESQMGTTALGTTAEVRGDLIINGTEHYLEQFKKLSCFGRPIIHPATRRLAGIICMTEVAPQVNPLSVPLIRGLVDDIAERLRDRSHSDHRAVIAHFHRASTRRDIAIAAVGDDLQLTNALAAELLAPGDFGTLRTMVTDTSDAERTVTLVSGLDADVWVDRVDGVRHAAVFHIRPRVAVPEVDAVAAAAPPRTAQTVAVCGEPGTGRSTHARSLLPDAVVVDVASALLDGSGPDLAGAVRRARSAGRGLIVDGADLLDDRSMRLAQAALAADDPSSPPIVLVSEPPTAAAPVLAATVACCRRRVTLPPLRQRTGELAALSHRLLAAIDPALRLAPDAADALASQEWPGNLTELGIVLDAAATVALARGSRQVAAADLPDGYRSSSRASRLMGMEQAERQAIIEALDASGGNKSHAAKSLGVSRTTLYARIRALGINR